MYLDPLRLDGVLFQKWIKINGFGKKAYKKSNSRNPVMLVLCPLWKLSRGLLWALDREAASLLRGRSPDETGMVLFLVRFCKKQRRNLSF